MLDQSTKERAKDILNNLNRKLILLGGVEDSEERRSVIDSIILSDDKDSELNQLKKLLGIEDRHSEVEE